MRLRRSEGRVGLSRRSVVRAGIVCGVVCAMSVGVGSTPASARVESQALPSGAVAVLVTAASTGMVGVPQTVTVSTRPVVSGRTVHVQMATTSGWVKVSGTRLDAQGRATTDVTASSAGVRRYRVALWNAAGSQVTAYSPTISIDFAPLSYTARLSCAASSALVRTDVPCTISIAPLVRLPGLVEVLQVKGRTAWQSIGSWAVPTTGVRVTSVEGYDAGVGQYRVRLLRNGTQLAVSNTVSISYSLPTQVTVGREAVIPKVTTRLQTWWPTDPIYWNVQVSVTVKVTPGVWGRPVRLQIYGWGGPYWTTIRKGTTNSAGQVRLAMMTMCPDSPCTNTWEQTYRVVVPAWRGYASASVRHRTLLVP